MCIKAKTAPKGAVFAQNAWAACYTACRGRQYQGELLRPCGLVFIRISWLQIVRLDHRSTQMLDNRCSDVLVCLEDQGASEHVLELLAALRATPQQQQGDCQADSRTDKQDEYPHDCVVAHYHLPIPG